MKPWHTKEKLINTSDFGDRVVQKIL